MGFVGWETRNPLFVIRLLHSMLLHLYDLLLTTILLADFIHNRNNQNVTFISIGAQINVTCHVLMDQINNSCNAKLKRLILSSNENFCLSSPLSGFLTVRSELCLVWLIRLFTKTLDGSVCQYMCRDLTDLWWWLKENL